MFSSNIVIIVLARGNSWQVNLNDYLGFTIKYINRLVENVSVAKIGSDVSIDHEPISICSFILLYWYFYDI